MKLRLILFTTLVSLLLLCVACNHQQAVTPLDLLWGENATGNKSLFIFLPGVRDDKEDFLNRGLFSRLGKSGIKADAVAADLHLAYLRNGTVITRLHEDIIVPAQNQGYKNIWLVGISLGGLNALLYLKNRPDDICGLVLLSPYLGEEKISNEIIQAGGIENWQPLKTGELNDEETLWVWLKNSRLNNVYLGTGSEDRFFSLHQQLAQLLPTENTHFIKGEHRWPVWQELWKYFVTLIQTEKGFEQCFDMNHPL
jgi:pimeloyl-ACP methyl ester carboxylesterase